MTYWTPANFVPGSPESRISFEPRFGGVSKNAISFEILNHYQMSNDYVIIENFAFLIVHGKNGK